MTTSTTLKLEELDRCVRCRARSYVRTIHPFGYLDWCAHDFDANLTALVSDGDSPKRAQSIIDMRDQIPA